MLLNPSPERKQYRVVGIAMFVIATALLAVRTVSYLIGSAVFSGEVEDEILVNILFELGFTVAVQIGILLVAVFLIYKYALKKTAREVLEFSNFRKTKWFNYALTVPIGFLALFVTLGVSTIWRIIIIGFGYTPAVPADTYPENFNPGLFFLEMFLIAVLPGFCEEFAIRGGLLTTMSKSFRGRFFYIVMAVAFGLFHQNIQQFFYTFVMGMLLVYLTIELKSVWPAVIIHFINNATSVYINYSMQGLNLPLSGNIAALYRILFTYPAVTVVGFLLLAGALVGLVFLIVYLSKRGRKKESEVEIAPKFKPTLRDNAAFIGALVTATLATLFSFSWGLFY